MDSVNIIEEYTYSESADIKKIPILLIELEKYLNLILHDNSWFREKSSRQKSSRQKEEQKEQKEQIQETINTLTNYMNIIHDYYNKISHETISNNIDINYQFVDTMTNAIIILYTYIYHYNIFDIDNHPIMDVFKISYIDPLIFFMERIIDNCYAASSKSIRTDELLFNFKDIIYNNKPECRTYMKTQTSVINDFINKIAIFYKIQPSNNRFVTIPKYTGICWFVSFIIGITYSDKNKQLLINKYDENKTNIKNDEHISSLSSKEIFTTLIYRIITNITKDNKTYNNIDIKDLNELNIYLKKTPIQCLIKLINDYIENYKEKPIPNEYIFIKEYLDDKYKEHKEHKEHYELYEPYEPYEPYKLNEYEKLGKFGIKLHNYFCLNLLYKFLNINSLYLLKSGDNIYSYDTNNTDPDVILINANTNKHSGDSLKWHHNQSSRNAGNGPINYEDITSKITYTPLNITYNGNNYELDYILYGSDEHNSWNNTGHAIVALSYNNKEYFYDSRYFIREYMYKDTILRYPCPLLNTAWKEDYKNNEPGYFCIKKCFHTNINPRSNLYLKTKDLSEENICYKRTDDIICCYVKISTEFTGGSKYYKFTNNKVEFQYNNKKYIRNIYINSKKKYVRLNNEYILLSKIKTYLKRSY